MIVEVEGRGDFGIAERIEFELPVARLFGRGDGGRLLLRELGGFDHGLHGGRVWREAEDVGRKSCCWYGRYGVLEDKRSRKTTE